jgi:hypothetical protein
VTGIEKPMDFLVEGWMLRFSFFFFAEVGCPFEFSRVSSKIQGTFSAFA